MTLSSQECHLRHDAAPAELVGAMLKCQGWAPACADLGMCLQKGSCFAPRVDCFGGAPNKGHVEFDERTSAGPYLERRATALKVYTTHTRVAAILSRA